MSHSHEDLIAEVHRRRGLVLEEYVPRAENVMHGEAFIKQVVDATVATVLDAVQDHIAPQLVAEAGEVSHLTSLSHYYFDYISTLEKPENDV